MNAAAFIEAKDVELLGASLHDAICTIVDAAIAEHDRKQSEAVASALRETLCDGIPKNQPGIEIGGSVEFFTMPQGVECTTDAVADFFYHAEQLASSRGFRRLSARYITRKGDDEICYEVDGDVNLSPDP